MKEGAFIHKKWKSKKPTPVENVFWQNEIQKTPNAGAKRRSEWVDS